MSSDMPEAGLAPDESAGLKASQVTLDEIEEMNSSAALPGDGPVNPHPHAGAHESQGSPGWEPPTPSQLNELLKQAASDLGVQTVAERMTTMGSPGEETGDPTALGARPQAGEGSASLTADPAGASYSDAVAKGPDPNAPSIPGLNPQSTGPYGDVPRTPDPNTPIFEGIPGQSPPGVPQAPPVINRPRAEDPPQAPSIVNRPEGPSGAGQSAPPGIDWDSVGPVIGPWIPPGQAPGEGPENPFQNEEPPPESPEDRPPPAEPEPIEPLEMLEFSAPNTDDPISTAIAELSENSFDLSTDADLGSGLGPHPGFDPGGFGPDPGGSFAPGGDDPGSGGFDPSQVGGGEIGSGGGEIRAALVAGRSALVAGTLAPVAGRSALVAGTLAPVAGRSATTSRASPQPDKACLLGLM